MPARPRNSCFGAARNALASTLRTGNPARYGPLGFLLGAAGFDRSARIDRRIDPAFIITCVNFMQVRICGAPPRYSHRETQAGSHPMGSAMLVRDFAGREIEAASSEGITFCVRCGGRLVLGLSNADARDRLICSCCDYVHYQNPKVLVACFVTCGSSVLLCRRALDPAYGRWSIPGGFLEEGETLEQAAARETFEESGVAVDPGSLSLYGVTTLTGLREVYVNFRVAVPSKHCEAGREALQTGFFSEHEVPWGAIAHAEIADGLRLFFGELNSNQFGIHVTSHHQKARIRRP
jgi:ADP-ribose pyrophosphatase YjhB (NUDIX family)